MEADKLPYNKSAAAERVFPQFMALTELVHFLRYTTKSGLSPSGPETEAERTAAFNQRPDLANDRFVVVSGLSAFAA